MFQPSPGVPAPNDEPQAYSRFNLEKSLESVFRKCFLIFQGTSRLNEDYRVVVVKKKYAFDPAFIALLERLGVETREHDAGDDT